MCIRDRLRRARPAPASCLQEERRRDTCGHLPRQPAATERKPRRWHGRALPGRAGHPGALSGIGGPGPCWVRPSGPEPPSVGPVTMTASFMILILLSQLNTWSPLNGLESLTVCYALITSDLPLRSFIMTIPMWSSPLNCIQISETSTKYTKGGHLSS